jgi:hypothetical protein
VHRREHAARTEKVRRVTTNNSSLRQATLQHPRGSCPKAFQSTN